MAIPTLNGREKEYVDDCLESTWISSIGKYITRFESDLASLVGTQHAVACVNGTAALHACLLACEVKPGDEVIVPTITYVATANAVSYCGAKPVLADIEPDTWNINPDQILERITPRTKGIVVVHLFGHPADMDPINKIAEEYGLFVVEDAAEAIGATYKGHSAGSLGDVGMFSFFGNKIITTGEGGAVTTNSTSIAERVRLFRGQGMDPNKRYWFPVIGYNYRMTNIQAAIGCAQLENFSWHLSQHRRVAGLYNQNLRPYGHLFSVQVEKAWAQSAHWMFNVILSDQVEKPRDDVIKELFARGIETRPMFYPMHRLPPYATDSSQFPVGEFIGRRGITLPTYAQLNAEDIEYICQSLVDTLIQS